MLEFPRWKYVLVALVMLLAQMFALPNFWHRSGAAGGAQNRLPMDEFARQAVEQSLSARTVAFRGSYLDDGKMILRFATVADQLKARDLVNEAMAADYISADDGLARARSAAPLWCDRCPGPRSA
jgi:preprotein translocase subunit SecD